MDPSQEARLLAALDHERAWREMLQSKLTGIEASYRQAQEQLVQARLDGHREHQSAARNGKICTALQERLLELEAAVRQSAQQRAADAAAATDRLTRRHAEFTGSLEQAARARDALARELTEARAALEEARQTRDAARARRESERAAEASRRDAREAEISARLAELADERDGLLRQLSAASAALDEAVDHAARIRREADARHELELATATSHRDALQTQLDEAVAQAAAAREAFDRQLNDAAAALERNTAERAAEAATAARRLAAREAEFSVAIAAATASHTAAEERVESLRTALQEAEARHAAERRTEADRRTSREAEAAAHAAKISGERDALARDLRSTSAALEASRAQQAREERAARAALEQTQAEAAASRNAFGRQLAEVAAALEQSKVERAADAAAASHQLAAREAELGAMLADGATIRSALEARVDELQAALNGVERELRDARTTLEQSRAEAASAREALERQVCDANAALAHEKTERAAHDAAISANLAQISSERDALTRDLRATAAALEESLANRVREESDARATLERTRAEAATAHALLEQQVRDAIGALAQEKADRAADVAAAAQHLAVREADLGTLLAEGDAARSALDSRLNDTQAALNAVEHELGNARAESVRLRRRLLEAASALRRRTAERRAQQEALLAAERADHEHRLERRDHSLRQVEAERDELHQSLATVRAELQALGDVHDQARQDFEQTHARSEAERQRLAAEYDQARESLDHLRGAFDTLERVSSEHALERSRLEGVVADRDAQISAQASGHVAAEQAWREASRQAEEALRQTVEARNSALAALQRQLDASQQENRWQFEHAPFAMCRVARDGSLAAANQALASALGYGTAADLAKVDLAAAVFEAPADLRWLIDRAAAAGAAEPVETVWKKRDRTRLTVRLQVVRATDAWVEIAADDITRLRATEEDLRHARRMEAVGRLASEVAATCDTLLRSVSHGGQHWLAAMESDLGLRHQGERLLGDVAHATSLLQRLAAYGNEQRDALEPVDLRRVLRNLEPVLKRVVGDSIEVVLPKHIPTFLVDFERSRVERVLVNVASYARERMPYGGRLKLDLTSAVVDRAFLDRYPNVRPGPHVVATVTEERGTRPADPPPWPSQSDDEAVRSADKPGVDLSALVRLLADHGGHLWVAAEPPGNMTLKIHLPLQVPDGPAGSSPSMAAPTGGRSLGRWFRH